LTDEASGDSKAPPKAHRQLTLGKLMIFFSLFYPLYHSSKLPTKVAVGGNGGGLASRRDGIPTSPATKSIPDAKPRSIRPSTSSYPTTRLAPLPRPALNPGLPNVNSAPPPQSTALALRLPLQVHSRLAVVNAHADANDGRRRPDLDERRCTWGHPTRFPSSKFQDV
jgi:hypothetical protein